MSTHTHLIVWPNIFWLTVERVSLKPCGELNWNCASQPSWQHWQCKGYMHFYSSRCIVPSVKHPCRKFHSGTNIWWNICCLCSQLSRLPYFTIKLSRTCNVVCAFWCALNLVKSNKKFRKPQSLLLRWMVMVTYPRRTQKARESVVRHTLSVMSLILSAICSSNADFIFTKSRLTAVLQCTVRSALQQATLSLNCSFLTTEYNNLASTTHWQRAL